MVRKNFGQTQQQQESKNKPSAKKRKRGWMIFGGVIVAIFAITQINSVAEQARLEKDNVPIVISDVDDNIKLDYHTNKREISAKISGISSFAEVKISENKIEVHDRKDSAGNIKYEIKDIKEGDSDISISVVDGKRRGDKTIKIHRQTKADYDKQELEKALKRAEKVQKEAEERKRREEAAAAARTRQRQSTPAPSQPAPAELNFRSCKEARAAGYSHMRRGEPGYSPHLDRDGDGIACDKHK